MNRTFSALAFLGTLALGACAFGFERPEIRIDGLRLGGLSLRGATVFAQLHVVNPNRFGLETSSLTYDLQVGGPLDDGRKDWSTLATGTFAETVRVAARDSATVEIPIDLSYAEMGGALRSIMDSGTFDYRVSGTVEVRDPIRRAVPYRHSGTVSMAGVRN